MAGWLKFILIGVISVLNLWLTMPAAIAVPTTDQSADVRSPSQPDGDDDMPILMIAPELINPDEIPLVEAQPESTSATAWLSEALTMPESAEPVEGDGSIGRETVDTTLDQWLNSVKSFFEGS